MSSHNPTPALRTVARPLLAAAAIALGLVGLAACSSDSGSDADATTTEATVTTAPAGDPVITDAWARTSPAGVSMGAAYFTITSPVADKLVGVSVPTSVAADAQLHETVMSDDTTTMMDGTTTMMEGTTTMMNGSGGMGGGSDEMTMREVEAISLPAGEAVALKPGGYHVMLMDLAAPLKTGSTIRLTLTFEKAEPQTITATVRES